MQILVLQSIEEGPKTSYGIKEHIGTIWDKKPSSGSLFPAIKKLSCAKLIKSSIVDNKKMFSITKKGSDFLDKLVIEKENDLIDYILFLKSMKQLNNRREVNIMEKLSERIEEPMKSKIKILQKTISESQKTIQTIMTKELNKRQEDEFKKINDDFLKRMKEFNRKLKVRP